MCFGGNGSLKASSKETGILSMDSLPKTAWGPWAQCGCDESLASQGPGRGLRALDPREVVNPPMRSDSCV